MDCWEVLNCSNSTRGSCPAYPDKGRSCWKITGTLCDGGRMKMASVGEKVNHCRSCEFYIKYADKF